MAIILSLSSRVVRSTKRNLPTLFEGKNRNIRRYRLIGDGHTSATCDNSICNGRIAGCGCRDQNRDCVFTIACDESEET
jgi:hypothetical protein